MIKSNCMRNIIVAGIIILLVTAAVWAGNADILSGRELLRVVRESNGKFAKPSYENRQSISGAVTEAEFVTETKVTGDEILKTIPAESLFVVRINNFSYTLGQIDLFTAGASPMPITASMGVSMMLAELLGSPQLSGVNMSGNFAVFATALPVDSEET